MDSSDNVYVIDDENRQVLKFDNDRKFITQWEYSSTTSSNVPNPADIAIDSSDKLFVADSYNHRIQAFAPDNPVLTTNNKDNVERNDISSTTDNTDSTRRKESVPQSPTGITGQV